MFEKEAEEYAEEHAFRVPYDGSNKFYDDKDYECSKEGFQKGAEFGYNKGFEFGVKSNEKVNQIVDNEWHYVKDGDLPTDDKYVLVSNG